MYNNIYIIYIIVCVIYIYKIKIKCTKQNIVEKNICVAKDQKDNRDVTSMLNYMWKISVKLLKGNDKFFIQIVMSIF